MISVPLGSFWQASWARMASRRLALLWALIVVMGVGGMTPYSARAASWQGAPARQMVLFGVEATPGSTQMDPKIAPVVQAQLRRLLPDHGFRMIKIKSDRVAANGTVKCDLGNGFVATSRLLKPLDSNGKIEMHFELMHQELSQFQTIVATPPDQFNFFDKNLPNGNRLLVGVGAR